MREIKSSCFTRAFLFFFAYFASPIMKGCEMREDLRYYVVRVPIGIMAAGQRVVVTVDYPGQRKNLKLLTTRLGQSSSFSF